MRIQYTKEYTRKNETPCVLLYCNVRDIFWLGKKINQNQYNGLYLQFNAKKIEKINFFFSESIGYQTVSTHLDKYYISENDFDFLIDKLKTRKDFERVINSMVELKKED